MNRLWGEQDSNLRRRSQQIYSLPRLTASVSPQLIATKKSKKTALSRASRGTRTPDLLITNQQLYQLSYAGSKKGKFPLLQFLS